MLIARSLHSDPLQRNRNSVQSCLVSKSVNTVDVIQYIPSLLWIPKYPSPGKETTLPVARRGRRPILLRDHPQ